MPIDHGTFVFDDGVMGAELVHGDWLFIYWINNAIGHMPKRLVKNFRKMEKLIRERGWKGWLMNSEKDHTEMHRLIKKVGGVEYDEDDKLLFFKKEFSNVS